MVPIHVIILCQRQCALVNGTVYLIESQILRRMLFSICSHFFGAHSFAKNVSEKQPVFCLQTQDPISTPARVCSASGRPGGHILTGFSLADAFLNHLSPSFTLPIYRKKGHLYRWSQQRSPPWLFRDDSVFCRATVRGRIPFQDVKKAMTASFSRGRATSHASAFDIERTERIRGGGNIRSSIRFRPHRPKQPASSRASY